MEPEAISRLSARLPLGSAIVSATNGKTTTAAMAAEILRRSGISLVHNRAGANMAGGIAATLLSAARPGGRMDGRLGLFEVDEFWLAGLIGQLSPRVIALGNLFRDQLDRYGELDTIADRWAAAIAALPVGVELALNADDPLIADLGRERTGVRYFGVEDPSVAIGELPHAADSGHCRACGAAYVYEVVYLGHLGVYRCPGCGRERPRPEMRAESITLRGTAGADFRLVCDAGAREVSLPLPGLYNVYNALAAATLCLSLGCSLDDVAGGLAGVAAAFGRAETVHVGGTELQLLLIKNPAGANEVLRTLALEPGEVDVLAVLNDRIADGRDISWVWDADWEQVAGRVRRVTCAGTRAAEMALRLKYAGVPVDRLTVLPKLGAALDLAVGEAAGGRLYALPTYTALLELREELTARGHVPAYWREAG
jgi:UDP-N-acetylmuramyl tripeptide synthase